MADKLCLAGMQRMLPCSPRSSDLRSGITADVGLETRLQVRFFFARRPRFPPNLSPLFFPAHGGGCFLSTHGSNLIGFCSRCPVMTGYREMISCSSGSPAGFI